jgi:REG-2-like HAD superfamily hydrolase
VTQVTDIKAIFFDAAGTLLHLPRGVAAHYCLVAEEWGIRLEEDRVGAAFRRAWKRLPPPEETRRARLDDDKGWWRLLVQEVLRDCGVAGWDEDFFEALYRHFEQPGVWELYPDVLPVLEVLRQRYPLGILSNFDGRLRAVLAHEGIADWFQWWVISSEVGSDKPSPYIFEVAGRQADLRPGEILHVGDDPQCDWEGARAAGWKVFELARPDRGMGALVNIVGRTKYVADQ